MIFSEKRIVEEGILMLILNSITPRISGYKLN